MTRLYFDTEFSSLTADAALISLPPLGQEAAERYDAAQAAHFAQDPRPHHALVDARALAAGVAAIEQSV